LPEYKKKLDEQLTAFDHRLENLNSLNKEWLHDLITRMDVFYEALVTTNKNLVTMNGNMTATTKQMDDIVHNRVNEISEQVIAKTSKYLIWFVIGVVGMSFLFSGIILLLMAKLT
jgi:hypothetical protein